MTMKKVDRRVRRTRRLLRDACIALVLAKGYEAVTVEEIAEKADVGRATFYIHYRDKEDLFVNSIGRISEEVYEQIAPTVFSQEGHIEVKPVQLIFEHAAQNADLYRVILSGAGNGRGLLQLRRDLAHYGRRAFAAEAFQLDLAPSVPVEVMTQHFVGALLGLVHWWLREDMPYPPEEMASMFYQLTTLGRAHVMGKETAEPGIAGS